MSVRFLHPSRPAIGLATLLLFLGEVTAEPQDQPVSITSPSSDLVQVVRQEADQRGVPLALADALVSVFRDHGANPASSPGRVGLMGIHPAMARMHGHRGDAADLLHPQVNIRFGMLHLAGAWALARGDVCLALVKYRTGYAEEDITLADARDCAALRARLAELGSPLASARAQTTPKAAPHRPTLSEPERPGANARPASVQPLQPETRSVVAPSAAKTSAGRGRPPAPKEADGTAAVAPHASAHAAAQQTPKGTAGSRKRTSPDLAVARIIAGGRTTWQPIPQARSNRASARRWIEHEKRMRQIEARVSPSVIQIMRP